MSYSVGVTLPFPQKNHLQQPQGENGMMFAEQSSLTQKLSKNETTHPMTSSATVWQQCQFQCQFHWKHWTSLQADCTYSAMKRLVDILVSGTLLLLLSPLFLLIILLIRVGSPGKAFFYQTRVGRHSRTFKMWKFRSMYIDAEQRKAELMKHNEMAGGVIFKMKKDPRVTRIGSFIRRFSIDEIPQLWNVFVGDMTLVGPRPPVPLEVSQYTPYQRQRLGVTPGITCIWQVSGRSEIPFEKQVELDLEYIATQSLWLDTVLLFKTVPAVLSGRGAY
jgi:lipopolysaccharide/colanic/teichoic acid biosynthesis glycosyltransferase